ncbi:MAG: D-alanyl-D-alanine carboxypeptidase/D-alanyl-D-alanine-endopeptidase [Thermoanaerobaculia bacterium]|jgi:D-alanyl-D-alanine carboxypeptidase/D-alanyl-D-alanine-endopeptidase (penicillin-binding protein 4)
MRPLFSGRVACLLVSAALLAAPPAVAAKKKAPRASPATLEQRLLAIAKHPPVRRSEAGVVVVRLGDAKRLVAVNADRPLVLASATKLFTSAAALDRLGPGYRFRTRLYRDAQIGPDGVLPGHLIVVGGGDPGLSGRWYDDDPLAVFRPWAQSLVTRGLREIQEGLVLDASFFDDVQVHPDWPTEQEARWYQAPVSALSYNDNVVLVRASGGVRPGAPALLGFDPLGPPLVNLISQVVTASRRTRIGVRRTAGSHTVVAAGAVGKNRTWTGDVTVPDPPLYLAGALAQVLQESGIRISAPPTVWTEATPPAPRVLLHSHETPLLPVLAVCNKRSQSFFAEQILKTLGAETRGKGTWENGRTEVRAVLGGLGLDPRRYDLADGSGRAHTNRASAGAYADFLEALATRWSHFEDFRTTLAVSGEPDGTLRHRLQTEATRGKVFAKTGNVAGVSTLCGYVTARSGQTYAFAILLNGGVGERRGHAFQDRFLQELANRG